MGYFKYAIAALALALFASPSVADAQNFQTLGTRRGAVGGAILGAIIGDQNNEALAGAAIGGLVGGTIGNVSGRNLDRQYGGGQPIYNYGGNRGYTNSGFHNSGFYNRPAVNIQYQRVPPIYRPSPVIYHGYGGGFHGGGHRGGYGGGYGRPSCGGRGW